MTIPLALIAGAAFVWFLYEITRLEGRPGRKWHHAYVGLVMAAVALFAPALFARVALGLVMLAGLLLAFPSRYDSKRERVHWSALATMAALIGVAIFVPIPIVRYVLVAVAIYVIVDDAAQHHTHNRQMRAGIPTSMWRTSWLHKRYEKSYREFTT